MRRVTLTKEWFPIVWLAFRATYPRKAKGWEQQKLCNALGAKLEAVSVPAPVEAVSECPRCGRPAKERDEGPREMGKATGTVLLERMEHEKLVSMLKDEEIMWGYDWGKIMETMVPAIEGAPEVEVAEKAKAKAGRSARAKGGK